MVSPCCIVFVVLAQLGAADILPCGPYRQPRRQQHQQPYRQPPWTFTPQTALGATDLVCLAGAVMLAAVSHRRMQLQRWPETSEAATVPDVVRDAWSQPNASEHPSVALPSDAAIEKFADIFHEGADHLVTRVASDEQDVQQRCLRADFTPEQADLLIARLRKLLTDRDTEQDLSRFVGVWTDGVREFSVEPNGQVLWRKAARPVASFQVREPAKINQCDGSLEFTLEFPQDRINQIGKATWHLGPDTVWQTFEQSMPHHAGMSGLTRDGRSSVPVQWNKAETDDWDRW